MDLNKIKLLKKEELLQKLNQNGFQEVARILEDKDINGAKLMDLREFEIFKWKLNSSQKATLWNCIKQINSKPSILMIHNHPVVPKKPSVIRGRNTKGESCELFKGKLQDILGGIGANTGSPSPTSKIVKNKPIPSPSTTKPLPPLPRLPPPRNGNIKNAGNPVKKLALPLPKETEGAKDEDEAYLQMHAPAQPFEDDCACDEYLTPIDVPETHNSKNQKILNEIIPIKFNERNKLPFTTTVGNLNVSVGNEDDKVIYESADSAYELSPAFDHVAGSKSSQNKHNNINATHRRSFDQNKGEEQISSTETSTKIGKGSLKDLVNNSALSIDEDKPQAEARFSFLTSKLNIFKSKNKSKIVYENIDVVGESRKYVEMPKQSRPLPDIPFPPKLPNIRLRQPIPPPRPVLEDPNSQDNYIELTNFAEPSSSRGRKYLDEEPQIYKNVAKPVESDEEQGIYENTPKTDNLEEEDQIYENTTKSEPEESNEIYENTSKTENLDEEDQIYENTARQEESKIHNDKLGLTLLASTTRTISTVPEDKTLTETRKNVQDLASLLSQELKIREQLRSKKLQQIEISDPDSEFEDDLPIYGNISNDDENNSSVTNSFLEHTPTLPNPRENISNVKRTPIYKTALPEIPKTNFPNVPNLKPLPLNRIKEESTNATTFTKNVNVSTKKDIEVQRALTNPKPVNYEHHIVNQRKQNKNGQWQDEPAKITKGKDVKNFSNVKRGPFYRETDRKGAKSLLSNLGSGAFLFRPSPTHFLALTVKHNTKIYNFGIERTPDNMLRLNTEESEEPPKFSTVAEFVAYFSREPLTFRNGEQFVEIYLKPVLPPDLF